MRRPKVLTAALIVAVLIAGVLILAATKADSFRVERATTINAPPEKVFPLINDFREWPKWSPWEKRDPDMRRTHSGAALGQGAVYAWEGNSKVGSGRMEIIEATSPTRAVIRLDFLKPFEAHNTADFQLTRKGESTQVTWAMFGQANFMSKLMQVFMSMDSMVGKDFEAGLANMKAAAEQ
jgi:uncharacterized protein YndB with AHSA1/START domain